MAHGEDEDGAERRRWRSRKVRAEQTQRETEGGGGAPALLPKGLTGGRGRGSAGTHPHGHRSHLGRLLRGDLMVQ